MLAAQMIDQQVKKMVLNCVVTLISEQIKAKIIRRTARKMLFEII